MLLYCYELCNMHMEDAASLSSFHVHMYMHLDYGAEAL